MLEDKIKLEDLIPLYSYNKLDKLKGTEFYNSSKAKFIRVYNVITLPIWTGVLSLGILYLGNQVYNLIK